MKNFTYFSMIFQIVFFQENFMISNSKVELCNLIFWQSHGTPNLIV